MQRLAVHFLITILFWFLICWSGIKCDDDDSLQDEFTSRLHDLKQPLEDSALKVKNLARKSAEKYPTLRFLNSLLTKVGKFLMGASMVVSFFTAFFPIKENSDELTYMKEKFNVVMNGISRIENQVKNLEFVVIHEVTKSSYSEYQRAIENLYMDWQYALNAKAQSQESINRAFFLRQYELQYKNAALNLFKGMLGNFDGELNNDLLSMAKERYGCNGMKLRYLCATITQIINQGLAVEGAFYSYMKMHERGEIEQFLWEKRMELLEQRCEAVITECQVQWEDYVLPTLTQTYKQFNEAPNHVLAEMTFQSLTKSYGQRAWFVFVYDELEDPTLHGFRSYDSKISKELQMKWKLHGKTFTAVSVDLDVHPEFDNKEDITNAMITLQRNFESCKLKLPNKDETFPTAIFNVLSPNATAVRPRFYYAVHGEQRLFFHGTLGRYVRVHLRAPSKCKSLHNFNYHLFAIG